MCVYVFVRERVYVRVCVCVRVCARGAGAARTFPPPLPPSSGAPRGRSGWSGGRAGPDMGRCLPPPERRREGGGAGCAGARGFRGGLRALSSGGIGL